ncbi:DUF1800 family protein [Roseateles cellulosilyticus]|uniref:DUF1800 family protein n=1 Tax=Pelomonas cellulosilytica TaxID=2906762 RepID=A0ABS8XUL5_9BURK|nr:DUF1800 family protein [Pelomonas sp. P8]MCE4554980.1 DUF1800 family protein [Pelomonas sp. P8]
MQPLHTASRLVISLIVAATTASLTACGGGGSAGGATSAPTIAAAPTPTTGSADNGAAGTPNTTAATPIDTGVSSAAADVSATEVIPTAQAFAGTDAPSPVLTVRARADVAGGVGAMMTLRIDGQVVGTVEVKSTTPDDYKFTTPTLKAGSKLDLVFTNDGAVDGVDRNLHIIALSDGVWTILPTISGSVVDRGPRSLAFDGVDTIPGQGDLFVDSALRLTWPGSAVDTQWGAKVDAVRFLEQASFGPTADDVNKVVKDGYSSWITAQLTLPYTRDFFDHVQAKYALGDAYRPKGANYTPFWVSQKFWERAARAPDQLRQRVAFALHQIFMVSQADLNLYAHGRAYAQYVDLLHKHAFGNYRNLLEDMALTPSMGIYLSHMRNRKEDPATGRMPDENFAREIMQLFSIGLYELNNDGSLKRDANGNPIETYTTADVMAMAKVFTGWSWAYPDAQLNESTFRYSTPSVTAANDYQIDFLPMKAYPGQHSTAEKRLFTGKSWAVTLPGGSTAQSDLKAALDALFNHPNVGPFVTRQLIQHLVTSNPSPAYINRVATVFNNNGQGVRGDLGAVVKAILLDTEARSTPTADFGKLREPVLRLAHWMRAMGAQSVSGQYLMQDTLESQGQRALFAPSVFGYVRPGYIPPNTAFSTRGATAPEFQIVNESTVAIWLNAVENLVTTGVGTNSDVSSTYANQIGMASYTNLATLPDHLNLMLLGGRMTPALRQQILDIMSQINITGTDAAKRRAQAALFLTLASPEFVFQP